MLNQLFILSDLQIKTSKTSILFNFVASLQIVSNILQLSQSTKKFLFTFVQAEKEKQVLLTLFDQLHIFIFDLLIKVTRRFKGNINKSNSYCTVL